MRQIEIPVEVQGYINDLKEQNTALSERCAMRAAEVAGLQAENSILRAAIPQKQEEAPAANEAADKVAVKPKA